jgi:hypothetical protein
MTHTSTGKPFAPWSCATTSPGGSGCPTPIGGQPQVQPGRLPQRVGVARGHRYSRGWAAAPRVRHRGSRPGLSGAAGRRQRWLHGRVLPRRNTRCYPSEGTHDRVGGTRRRANHRAATPTHPGLDHKPSLEDPTWTRPRAALEQLRRRAEFRGPLVPGRALPRFVRRNLRVRRPRCEMILRIVANRRLPQGVAPGQCS